MSQSWTDASMAGLSCSRLRQERWQPPYASLYAPYTYRIEGALYVGPDQELQRISHGESGKRLWPGAPEARPPMAMLLK